MNSFPSVADRLTHTTYPDGQFAKKMPGTNGTHLSGSAVSLTVEEKMPSR